MINSTQQKNNKKTAYVIALFFLASYLAASLIFYPSILLNGRIWAEEAREFLIPLASAESWMNTILYLHKGHLDLIPNIATSLALKLPIEYAPYIYVWVAVVPVAIFSICFGQAIAPATKALSSCRRWPALLLWVSAIGFLASCGVSGIESHLNTINSWSYIVASVALLIPVNQSKSASPVALTFVSISPILAFPCVLFAPWLLIQSLIIKSLKIKIQNLLFFLFCLIQIALPKLLPSSWAFADDRCLQIRDIISILPTLIIKNLSPLAGNVNAFEPLSGSFLSSYYSLFAITISCIIIVIMLITFKPNTTTKFNPIQTLKPSSNQSTIGSAASLIPPIFFWQLLAIASAGAGAYAQLMMGGGYRYANSLYLVILTILSKVFTSFAISENIDASNKKRTVQRKYWKPIAIQPLQLKLILIVWLSLMTIISIDQQNKRSKLDDRWCFISRPTWNYTDHREFKIATQNPSFIVTCPRGWTNAMQNRTARTRQEKSEYCNRSY